MFGWLIRPHLEQLLLCARDFSNAAQNTETPYTFQDMFIIRNGFWRQPRRSPSLASADTPKSSMIAQAAANRLGRERLAAVLIGPARRRISILGHVNHVARALAVTIPPIPVLLP